MRKQICMGVALFAAAWTAGCRSGKETMGIEEAERSLAAETDREPGEGSRPEPDRTVMMEAYRDILEGIYQEQRFPGGEDFGYQPGEGYDITSNLFAVYDVDFDGKEELIVTYTTTYTAGMTELIYGFDDESGTVREEFREYPLITYYDNGVAEAGFSHNHGLAGDGAFWPYSLYQYDAEKDVYSLTATVDAWSKNFRTEDYDGNPFPDDVDEDGDGLVYLILMQGRPSETVDSAEYEAWRESVLLNAQKLQVPCQRLTPENLASLS